MLVFENPGEIDIRAATTLGVNAKRGENPIGHFGTGLKYAIASILRLGGTITIWSGLEEYEFGSSLASIREKDFHIVYMRHQEKAFELAKDTDLGFTTDLGKDWEPWMVYRELRSNVEDEGGVVHTWNTIEGARSVVGAGTTCIIVDCAEIEDAHHNRGSFWIEDEPLWQGHGLEIFSGFTENLYYHRIRATAPNSSKTAQWAFRYSITKSMALTEDRTFASFYDARTVIAKALAQCGNEEIIEAAFESEAESSGFDFDHWDIQPSQKFVAVVLRRIERKERVPASARALVHRQEPEAVEEAELEIPSTYEDMERLEPEAAPEVHAYRYEWANEMEDRMKKLEKQLKYWRACARKLGARR